MLAVAALAAGCVTLRIAPPRFAGTWPLTHARPHRAARPGGLLRTGPQEAARRAGDGAAPRCESDRQSRAPCAGAACTIGFSMAPTLIRRKDSPRRRRDAEHDGRDSH